MEKNTSIRPSKTKVIHDLSNQLGKLPPQAVDLEETVLAQLMLESNAYGLVKDVLEADFFYTEPHQIIFAAIKSLGDLDEPVNMRTVSYRLKQQGKLEVVGGAFYIADITSKASSAANIEYHARIIIELYLKREFINIASKVHQEAYEDSSDALLLFNDIEAKFREIEQRAFKSSGPNRIKQLWKETLLTTIPDEYPPIIHIDNIPVAWPDAHTLLVGKKKSRKTLFMVWLVSQFLQNKSTTGQEVLIFDTEQSKRHVFKIREKILKITGKTVAVFFLKGKNPDEIKEFITQTVKHWLVPPQLIINDGIKDMMYDINDPVESTQTVVWMMKLMIPREGQPLPPHVVNVLHLNKGDSNPRGHLGTELQNKAECTIELELDEQAGCTNVKCESSREKAFAPFAFTHDHEELPMIVLNSGHEAKTPEDSKERLVAAFDGEMLPYGLLVKSIMTQFELGTNRAKSLIAKFIRDGWVAKSGSAHDRSTVYKCLISSTNGIMKPVSETPQYKETKKKEPDLFTAPPAEEAVDDLPF